MSGLAGSSAFHGHQVPNAHRACGQVRLSACACWLTALVCASIKCGCRCFAALVRMIPE